MQFFDPDRPRLHNQGLPMHKEHNYVLPCFYVSPNSVDEIEISVFLPMSSGGASRHTLTTTPAEFPTLWAEWLSNPEQVLLERFGWTIKRPTPAPAAPLLDLDELLKDL